MAMCKPKDSDGPFPHLAKVLPPSYYQRAKSKEEERRALQIPQMEKRAAQQVINGFKMLARGWDRRVENSISVPSELFFFEGVGTRFYSSDERADLANLARGLGMGKVFHPNTEYGIVLYETSSTVYFVLFDAKRRIAVREPLLCHHNTPPEREWSKIKRSIDSAVALAGTEAAIKKGLFAVYDGTLKLVAPEESVTLNSK